MESQSLKIYYNFGDFVSSIFLSERHSPKALSMCGCDVRVCACYKGWIESLCLCTCECMYMRV